MIHAARERVAAPAALTGPSSRVAKELAENQLLAAQGKHSEMSFNAYRDDTVKAALAAIFHRKCAYCEISMLGQQPGDVEHFRPKGKVSRSHGGTGKVEHIPGYYWLAAEWSNLLPSCVFCNRENSLEIVDGQRRVVGKANWFPVRDESLRASSPDVVGQEPRLLLDPCVDDPSQHLAFTDDGGIESISQMGAETIRVCALDRLELLQARARENRLTMRAIGGLLSELEIKREPKPQDIEDLAYVMSPEAPFSAYAKHLVRRHLAPYLNKLGL